MDRLLPRFAPSLRGTSQAACLLAVALVFGIGTAQGQPPEAESAVVPVKRVVLFSSGVGYFEHRGSVEGNATVDLSFRVEDVNDLLKSMVLQDLSGGRVSTVTYGSRDPITKTLQTFAIDLTRNPTLGQLLEQIRGEVVELEAPTAVRGTIIGVERHMEKVEGKDELVEVEYVTLLTEDGLRRLSLNNVNRIRLINEELDGELRQALAVLAQAHATDKKTVTLNFLGQGTPRRPGRLHPGIARSGRRAIAWCWRTTKSHSCKAGRSWKTPATPTGRTST